MIMMLPVPVLRAIPAHKGSVVLSLFPHWHAISAARTGPKAEAARATGPEAAL